jgi:hypothetical protein
MTEENFLSRDDVDVIDPSGRILFFSIRRFIESIGSGSVCFICGADPNSVRFNDEHVIPDWVLTECGLHSRTIMLPNEARLRYGQYKIPCCETCNTQMSDLFERPISNLVKGGLSTVTDYIVNGGFRHIFQWLALTYLKTYLKDRHLRFFLDHRKGDDAIADLYDWKELHHIHCIARAFFTGANIEAQALGSIIVCPARNIKLDGKFDYADSYDGRTLLLRIGEIAFLAVLNDSCAVWNLMQECIARLGGPLSSMQLRELMARMAYANIHLPRRPQQYSTFEDLYAHADLPNTLMAGGTYTIGANIPDTLDAPEVDSLEQGKMLAFYVKGPAEANLGKERCEGLMKQLEDGLHSLIFDGEGKFLVNPLPLDGEIVRPVRMNFSGF